MNEAVDETCLAHTLYSHHDNLGFDGVAGHDGGDAVVSPFTACESSFEDGTDAVSGLEQGSSKKQRERERRRRSKLKKVWVQIVIVFLTDLLLVAQADASLSRFQHFGRAQ